MADDSDSTALRELWNDPRSLKQGEWIAFRDGKVENSSDDLEKIVSIYADDIAQGISPIFAFVDFEIVQ